MHGEAVFIMKLSAKVSNSATPFCPGDEVLKKAFYVILM